MGIIFKSVGSLLIMGGVVALTFVGTHFANKLDVANELAKTREENTKLREDNDRLAMANRLLKVEYLTAKFHMKKQYRDVATGKLMSELVFTEVDDEDNPRGEPFSVRINGGEVYIDGLVGKFDDEFVEKGDPRKGTALFVFRRIFGDGDKPEDGYLIPKSKGQPLAYENMGGPTSFEKEFWPEFWKNAHDTEWMKKNGMRAMHGTSNSIKLQEGFEYRVKLRSTGDLTTETIPVAKSAGSGTLNNSRKPNKPWRAD